LLLSPRIIGKKEAQEEIGGNGWEEWKKGKKKSETLSSKLYPAWPTLSLKTSTLISTCCCLLVHFTSALQLYATKNSQTQKHPVELAQSVVWLTSCVHWIIRHSVPVVVTGWQLPSCPDSAATVSAEATLSNCDVAQNSCGPKHYLELQSMTKHRAVWMFDFGQDKHPKTYCKYFGQTKLSEKTWCKVVRNRSRWT